MTDWQRKNAEPAGSLVLNEKSGNYERMEGFPLDRAKDLLEKEGRYNKPAFRGKEGVDPTARARRAVPIENLGSSDIYLDIPQSDFRAQRDSKGVVIKPKKGKHLFPAVDKLKSLFKDEKNILDMLNLKRGDTFTFEGKDYKFQKIGTNTVGKDELDRSQFLLSPEEGSNYYKVVTVIAEDSLGRTNYIGLSKFLDDPEKYIGKNIPKEKTGLFSDIRRKLGLAEGGEVAMNQQMSFAFEDGGLRDDGIRQDPVSGNEVPSGSMAKEVRDDIPAQLSEGEYVVPADVVRYYGVKFFEDIRDRAKMGLRDMEARGRIGGEPVPTGGPMNNDDLSPEEMAAISEMMGMAQGGAVDMYKQQQNMYNPPAQAVGNPMQQMNAGGAVRGYNQAGSVTSQPAEQDMLNAAAAVNQSRASGTGMAGAPLGFSIYRPQAEIDAEAQGAIDEVTPEPEKVTLYSPEGVPIELELPRDQATYDALLSQGYTTEVVAKTPQPRGNDDDDPPSTPDPTAWMKNFDYTNASKLAEQTSALFDPKSPGLLGALGIAGGAFGAIGKMSNVAQANANIALLEAQGINTDSLKAKRDKYIETSGLSGIQKTIPWIMDGDQLKAQVEQVMGNDLFKNTPKPTPTPTETPTETPTQTPKTPQQTADSLKEKASNAKNTSELKAFQDAAAVAQKAADTGKSIAEVGREIAPSTAKTTTATEEATGGQGNQGQGSGWGGMNKGGLMATKPKRKTKRQYKKGGLAGNK